MDNKSVICLFVGIVLGGAGGVLGTMNYFKKKYERIAEDEINKVLAGFEEENNEYRRIVKDKYAKDEEERESSGDNREEGILSDEKRAEIKEKLRRNREEKEKKFNYAGVYAEKNELRKASEDRWNEDNDDEVDEDSIEEEEDDGAEEAAFIEEQKNRNKPPKIISEDAAANLDENWESEVLTYYIDDEIVADEDDEIVERPDILLGNALDQFDFRNNNEKLIYVANYQLNKVYEVSKVFGGYGD